MFLYCCQIKESADKAVIHVKVSTARKPPSERPNTAPAKIESPTRASENDAKAKRPKTGVAKKPAAKKLAASSVTNLGKIQIKRFRQLIFKLTLFVYYFSWFQEKCS